ncbi:MULTISPECIES: hypothetical protein [Prevotella]|uniref:hypothetical protein n=1 Tax=Prevotella melaninogenica TaxID=28132 RepID=UPI001BA88491|nr:MULTISPECIES: hypothetical protein [Prevotella]MBF1431189.1 hypothetical protein [Prevotella melaninogenica]MBF1580069.1 hypothetical protein [Prevotella sp.]MBF1611790.1 hypothetical protein [Prevotella sp.]MBF1617078.1 hypothetical protein [Prevotella sp.]QUB55460.1 hypothetical protein J5A72_03795 [Prevotella melaninogenica]
MNSLVVGCLIYSSVLQLLSTFSSNEVWTDIEREACVQVLSPKNSELLSLIIGFASAMLKQAWYNTRLAL